MSLFLLFGTSIFWLFLLRTQYSQENSSLHIKAFSKGLLIFIPSLILFYFLRELIPSAQGSILSIFRPWYQNFFFFGLIGTLSYFLFYSIDANPKTRCELRSSFLFGTFAPLGLITLLNSPVSSSFYQFLILPFLWIVFCYLIPVIIEEALNSYGAPMYLFFTLALFTSLALCLPGWLIQEAHPFLGTILAILYVGGTSFLYLRRRH